MEQIAGDELRPDDPEALIATGLLRMGPWGTQMIPQKESRQIYLDDLVHNVGQSFLSMPMRCCKCHDHKFDPLPTRDYYKSDPEDKKPPRHVGLTYEEKGMKKVREQDVWIWARRLERYLPLAQGVYNGQDDFKNGRKLREPKQVNAKWRPENFILAGGSLEAPLKSVKPGVGDE